MLMPESKPRLYLSTKDLPEIKDWQVGKEYTLVIRVTQKSKSEEAGRISGSFEINQIRVQKKSLDEMNDTEALRAIADRKRSDFRKG